MFSLVIERLNEQLKRFKRIHDGNVFHSHMKWVMVRYLILLPHIMDPCFQKQYQQVKLYKPNISLFFLYR